MKNIPRIDNIEEELKKVFEEIEKRKQKGMRKFETEDNEVKVMKINLCYFIGKIVEIDKKMDRKVAEKKKRLLSNEFNMEDPIIKQIDLEINKLKIDKNKMACDM